MRLFTEDLDRRRLARNEGTGFWERKREGRIEKPRWRDRNRKVRRAREARGFGGRNKPRWWRRRRMRQQKKKKRIRGFSRQRVEWLGGRIIELPLIPSSPRYPRVKRGKRSTEETARERQWRWHGSEGWDRRGSGWSLVVRVPSPLSGGNQENGIEGMITFVSYLTLERAG